MKKIYLKPQIAIVTTTYRCQILAGSEEKGVVNPGQGEGKTKDGDEYIVLSKQHNAWSTWDEE